jgi:hypothetical protein
LKEQFVPYEISLKLKEKGFDWHCLAVYMNGEFQIPRGFGMSIITKEHVDVLKGKAVLTPLWQQVIEWFLIEHNLYIYIERDGGWWIVRIKDLSREDEEGVIDIEMKNVFSHCFDEMPKARQVAIEYVLTLI